MSQHLEQRSPAETEANRDEDVDLNGGTATASRPNRFLRHLSRKCLLLIGSMLVTAFAIAGLIFKGENDAFLGLDQGSQEYVWKCEHVAFELETYLGKPLIQALKDRDVRFLRRCFLGSFSGAALDWADAQTLRHGVVSETRCQAASAELRPVDADGMVEYLLGLADQFGELQGAKLRVLHNDEIDAQKGEWKLHLLLSFGGQDRDGRPLELVSQHRVTARFANDAELKLRRIIERWQVESQALRRSERPLMEEVTEQVGLTELPLIDNWKTRVGAGQGPGRPYRPHRRQLAVEDFDRDGDLDIVIATVEGHVHLLESIDGKRFDHVTEKLGLPSQLPGRPEHRLAAWIDYDNDGFPDVLLGKHLYRNERGERFSSATVMSGLTINKRPAGAAVADYDGDGLLDLYVLHNEDPDRTPQGPSGFVGDNVSGGENELWHNEGNGRFRDVTREARASGGRRQSFAAAWLFIDKDTLPDLYIANDFGSNLLLRNRGDGTFEDIAARIGADDFSTSMGVAVGHLDNRDTPVIYVANMYSKMGRRIVAHVKAEDYPAGVYQQIWGSGCGHRLYRKPPGQARFEEISDAAGVNAVGWGWGPAMGDLDGDGLLDLYATAGYISVDREKPDG